LLLKKTRGASNIVFFPRNIPAITEEEPISSASKVAMTKGMHHDNPHPRNQEAIIGFNAEIP
jgi:hypothetical protein